MTSLPMCNLTSAPMASRLLFVPRQPEGDIVSLRKVVLVKSTARSLKLLTTRSSRPVPVEVGHGRAAGTARGRACRLMSSFLVHAAGGRLDPGCPGPVGEGAVAVVHHQRVGPVNEGIAHAGGQENVLDSRRCRNRRWRCPRARMFPCSPGRTLPRTCHAGKFLNRVLPKSTSS